MNAKSPPKLRTPAMFRGMSALINSGGTARISNKTGDGLVYWQTADRFVRDGLARRTRGMDYLEVTDLGRQVWQEAWRSDG